MRLSVNVNKVATLRNSRGGTVPRVLDAVQVCLEAGVAGITVHPRSDERHITPADVRDVAEVLQRHPAVEYNIEGDPRPDFLDLVREVQQPPIEQVGVLDLESFFPGKERTALALAVNQMIASGELAGPIAFTRDHLDAGAMAHPNIMTENMQDGSDAIADWPLLNAMVSCSSMADLVAIHSGGGGYAGTMTSAGLTRAISSRMRSMQVSASRNRVPPDTPRRSPRLLI